MSDREQGNSTPHQMALKELAARLSDLGLRVDGIAPAITEQFEAKLADIEARVIPRNSGMWHVFVRHDGEKPWVSMDGAAWSRLERPISGTWDRNKFTPEAEEEPASAKISSC